MYEFIGLIAGLVTMSAQAPQIYKSIKTKSTYDVSLYLYLILFSGVLMWIVFGLYNDETVFWMNLILEFSIVAMIYLKLRYGMHG